MNRFLSWCTAFPSRIFLIGMIFGMATMGFRAYGIIQQLYNTPVIIAEPVDNAFERYTKRQTFFIHNCPKRGKTLQIQIRTQDEVIAFGKTFGYGVPGLLGYTDDVGNRIVCVDSMEVLIHELRHIFEGGYHRNMPTLKVTID